MSLSVLSAIIGARSYFAKLQVSTLFGLVYIIWPCVIAWLVRFAGFGNWPASDPGDTRYKRAPYQPHKHLVFGSGELGLIVQAHYGVSTRSRPTMYTRTRIALCHIYLCPAYQYVHCVIISSISVLGTRPCCAIHSQQTIVHGTGGADTKSFKSPG